MLAATEAAQQDFCLDTFHDKVNTPACNALGAAFNLFKTLTAEVKVLQSNGVDKSLGSVSHRTGPDHALT